MQRTLIVELSDGRVVRAPLNRFPRLAHASPRSRSRWELLGGGIGIRWPALDEDLSVAGLAKDDLASRKRGLSRRQNSLGNEHGVDFRGGVRGKYLARYRAGTNVVLLDPDVAEVFQDSASVNRALRAFVSIANRVVPTATARARKR